MGEWKGKKDADYYKTAGVVSAKNERPVVIGESIMKGRGRGESLPIKEVRIHPGGPGAGWVGRRSEEAEERECTKSS